MFSSAYRKTQLTSSILHVYELKKAEICFLVSSLNSVNVVAILEITRGIKRQIQPVAKPDGGGVKAACTCFDPKSAGSNPGPGS